MNRETLEGLLNRKPLCGDCGCCPKSGRKSRCYFCDLKSKGTDAERAAAMERQASTTVFSDLEGRDVGTAECCGYPVPSCYMSTRKRCRGCSLLRTADKRAQKTYGLAEGDYERWYKAQDGRCYGCDRRQKVTGLAVHHRHDTGEALFLSCGNCNKHVMGSAMDNPHTLLRLALGNLFAPHEGDNAYRIKKILSMVQTLQEGGH